MTPPSNSGRTSNRLATGEQSIETGSVQMSNEQSKDERFIPLVADHNIADLKSEMAKVEDATAPDSIRKLRKAIDLNLTQSNYKAEPSNRQVENFM